MQRSSLDRVAPFLDPQQDVLLSVEQVRHRLLALACLCPGASTLIGNLLRSVHTKESMSLRNVFSTQLSWFAGMTRFVNELLSTRNAKGFQQVGTKNQAGHVDSTTLAGRRWLKEYVDGCKYELFTANVSWNWQGGWKFYDAVSALHGNGVLLIGKI